MGMVYATRFLKDLEDFGTTTANRLKVVLVGLANAGKTSLAARLESRRSSGPLPTAEERTVGVEIRDIQLGPGPANGGSGGYVDLDVKLWDFAGQRAYYDTHQVRDNVHSEVRLPEATISRRRICTTNVSSGCGSKDFGKFSNLRSLYL